MNIYVKALRLLKIKLTLNLVRHGNALQILMNFRDTKYLFGGSTVQDKDRIPNDLDIIIEYTGHSIEPEQEKSIESIIKSEIYIKDFSRVDPVVKHRFETPDIIANSRVSQVYSVTEDSYFSYFSY